MISLLLAASMIAVIDPPQVLPCALSGFRVVMADGSVIHAVRADYMPSELGIVIVPVAAGRVFCSGFESAFF